MEIVNGLIQRHRIYWGWFGMRQLMNNTMAKDNEADGAAQNSP